MKLSENITWTDVFTLVLILVTVGFYIYNIWRENKKAKDILQAKNYYFLSLMLQIQKKKLSVSFSEFVKLLGEDGRESFDLKFYPVVESRSIKNIAVDDLLKYYSEPVRHQNDMDFEHIQKAWFYCFEYCQQWESSQEGALQENNDIVERGKVFYDEFSTKYEKILIDINKHRSSNFSTDFFEPFVELLCKHQNLIESNQKLPCMYAIVEDIYKPICRIYPKDDLWLDGDILATIKKGQKIYSQYWVFIQGEITHFSKEIENQCQAELEFGKSITNLINYSIQHSNGNFKDMYRTLGNHVNGKQ